MNDASMTEMSETGKVKFFLSPSNRLLSASSGEDVVGCEEIVERVAAIRQRWRACC